MPGTSRVTDAPPPGDLGPAPAVGAVALAGGGRAVPVGGGCFGGGWMEVPARGPRPHAHHRRTSSFRRGTDVYAGGGPPWGREGSLLAPGRAAPGWVAALWPTPRGAGGQLGVYTGRRDTRWHGDDPTDGGAVAGGGRATATWAAESCWGHPGSWDSGPVAL